MASREAGARGGSRLADRESSSKGVAPKKVLEMMKEATGASDEDICVMLQLCGGDANEATEKLLENPFERVKTKQEKRKEWPAGARAGAAAVAAVPLPMPPTGRPQLRSQRERDCYD
ncbi:hypothetical protein MNEG_6082 [Monoraphidium neglectum]|uniref:GBF-interacting protein 1 N-terminal domain-containing protein n=1 Tax=Monoraphidium neglectum TaxID=145388 RepID=A0A0D2JS88_9CHLO|nr:hypothetical protein MNEG_6082 [Monoraphidium neglectum]KIZ01883.1 hypothetical protein MNEG_6082 [Monoraphidium neglectum]|eukprot:XP_013900902.1 hypothetical protein MNEG_6082 [Monoraphidium neglectum]